ncbi:MAG: hypothetical protein GX459_12835 [Bacteroidales bacterium]|nr:hypothetical protein [Bacteroidales bacterium]
MSIQLDLFYNTTSLGERELIQRKKEVRGQNEKILDFFRQNPGIYLTPFEVQKLAGLVTTPVTSIRRAINTLTAAGYLEKTDIMKPGEYGAINHTWRLKNGKNS